MRTIDLNADLGEGAGQDAKLIQLVSSANIACGGHAGNETTMRDTIEASISAGVAIGAHPGYEDPEHFGRRFLKLEPAAIADMVSRQIERLASIADRHSAPILHIKPHGALYNQANQDAALAEAIATGIRRVLPGCALYVPPSGALATAGNSAGLAVRAEAFADRRYQQNGNLVPRGENDAVIDCPQTAAQQALEIASKQQVRTQTNRTVPLAAATLCVHGDAPHATHVLTAVRRTLENQGFIIRAPGSP